MRARNGVLRNTQYRYGYHARGTSWHEIRRSEPEWVVAKQLRVGDQVLSPVECPYTLADGGLAALEIRRGEFIGRNQFGSVFPHPTAVPVPEDIQLTPAVARFLGLYAAEGFTSRNGVVGFAIATYEEDLTEFITSSMKNVFHTNPKGTDTTRHPRRVWCRSHALATHRDP